jgi:hypothetical protein
VLTTSRVFFARSLTKGRAIGGIRADAVAMMMDYEEMGNNHEFVEVVKVKVRYGGE